MDDIENIVGFSGRICSIVHETRVLGKKYKNKKLVKKLLRGLHQRFYVIKTVMQVATDTDNIYGF